MVFRDREEAGKKLAELLKSQARDNPVVIALPRGGVPVAAQVAEALNAPLDVLATRKVGAPENPEFGIGAITENGYYYLNPEAILGLGISQNQITTALEQELIKVEHQVERFRNGRPLIPVAGRNVLLVDDGLATGVTAQVACQYLKKQGVKRLTLAVPVCARESVAALSSAADQVICLEKPERFFAVGLWYEDFSQVLDEEVTEILKAHRPNETPEIRESEIQLSDGLGISTEVEIAEGRVRLPGHLTVPSDCGGIVLFAHGSGSSRFSPRNAQVARTLNQAGIGTLLFDLLSVNESEDRRRVFDIPLLARRLVAATRWLRNQDSLAQFPVGYFGASTGGGAALWAAAELTHDYQGGISAVVSRGGRPDLAMSRLNEVTSPTLLLVGALDEPIIDMNREALPQLKHGKLVLIPGASHLFEEPGTLEQVAEIARNWFLVHFVEARPRRGYPTAA